MVGVKEEKWWIEDMFWIQRKVCHGLHMASREKIGARITMSHSISSTVARKATDLERGVWGRNRLGVEAEVGAETGWIERPEEIISEKLNLKYWENCSCGHLNIEAKTTEKCLGWRYKYTELKTMGMNDITSTHIPPSLKRESLHLLRLILCTLISYY